MMPFRNRNLLSVVYSLLLYSLSIGSIADSRPSFSLGWDDTQYLTYIASSAIETPTTLILTRGEFNALSPAARLQIRSAFIDNLLSSGFTVMLQDTGIAVSKGVRKLDIELIPDDESPHGFSFNLMVSWPESGVLVATMYTFAEPHLTSIEPVVHYITTEEGYERQVIIPEMTYSLEDVARTLAHELIKRLPQ